MDFKKLLNEFEVYFGAVFQGIMIIILFLQVVSRYVFNYAFPWAEELAIIFFILSIYFGATAAIKRNQHLRLEILLSRLSPKNRLIMDIIGNTFFTLFNCIILTGIFPIVQRLKLQGTSTAVTNIPKWSYYAVLPFLFIIMIIRLVQDSSDKIKQIKSLNEPTSRVISNN